MLNIIFLHGILDSVYISIIKRVMLSMESRPAMNIRPDIISPSNPPFSRQTSEFEAMLPVF